MGKLSTCYFLAVFVIAALMTVSFYLTAAAKMTDTRTLHFEL